MVDRQDVGASLSQSHVRCDQLLGIAEVARLAGLDVPQWVQRRNLRGQASQDSTTFQGRLALAVRNHRIEEIAGDLEGLRLG